MNPANKKGLLPEPHQQRLPRWVYWVFVPFSALVYTGFCWWFAVETWGYRGETKPWWFDIAFILAAPGMFLPPYIGTLLCGGLIGFGLLQLARWIWRARQQPFEK